MIRLTIPSIEQDDLDAVCEVLKSGQLVQGRYVAAFEARVADYVGVEHAVAVSNCTSALFLALSALDIGKGDRVAVTAYSWPATANVIALCGAEPIFVDIDQQTFNMSAIELERALRKTRVKAVLAVHAFGGAADMPALLDIADRHGVPLIEDAACALGAELNGRRTGSWGAMNCFSFHPRKAITTGEGGMITTSNARLAKRLRILRNHGQDPDSPTPDFVAPGHNMRLTEFQAALGGTQMNKLERIIQARRENAARYDHLLRGTDILPPAALSGTRHVYQSYVALLPAMAAGGRREIIANLRQRGIETTIGTYHMPLVRHFRDSFGFAPGDFPVTDDIAARAISLPLFEGLTAAQQATVIDAVQEEVGRELTRKRTSETDPALTP